MTTSGPRAAGADAALHPDSLRVGAQAAHRESLWRASLAQPATIQAVAAGPNPRFIHTSIFDPVRQRMVVFGGETAGPGYSDEAWTLTLNGTPTWTLVQPAGTSPGGRAAHAAVYDPVRDRMIVFGGWNSGRRNDVWALTLGGTPTWSEILPGGTAPAGRTLHSAIYDPVRDRLIVFGGYKDSEYLNDVWALNLSGTPAWTQLEPTGIAPAVRREHTAVYDPQRDRMIVFGGVGTGPRLNDVWSLPLSGTPAWQQLATGGVVVPGLAGHTAVYEPTNGQMLVFSGIDATNSTWRLTLGTSSGTWDLMPVNGAIPPGRGYGTAIWDTPRSRMIVFAGWNGGYLNDLHALSSTGTWTTIAAGATTVSTGPSPRYLHTAVLHPLGNQMIVFGGFPDGPLDPQFHTLTYADPPGWASVAPSGTQLVHGSHSAIVDLPRGRMIMFGGYDGARRNDVWSVHLSGLPVWTQLQPAGTRPAARNLHSAIYDPARQRMVVFGGYADSGYLGDVWQLSLDGELAWSQLAPAGTPPSARREHTAIHDPLRDRMIVFGGSGIGGKSNEVWALSLGDSPAWTKLTPTGTPPVPRFGHSAVYDPIGDRMLVFGGIDDSWYLNDTWQLSLADGGAWSRLQPAGTLPVSRLFHTAVLDTTRNAMFVWGGHNGVNLNTLNTLLLGGAGEWLPPGNVPPVPIVPTPLFTVNPSGLPATIQLGQSITVTTTVINTGQPTDDGRISIAFPDLDDPGDAPRVTSPSTGDPPGFTVTPAGGTLENVVCEPLVSGHLVAEYRDQSWDGVGLEPNTFAVTVFPRTAGTFAIDVRATLKAPDDACPLVSAVPGGTEPLITDQQGFTVRRYTVTVTEPPTTPVPRVAAVAPPASITLGQTVTLSLTMANEGLASDDGRIVVGFPTMSVDGDEQYLTITSSGDDSAGAVVLARGAAAADSLCQPMTSTYLAAEYHDSDWRGLPGPGETNTLELTVRPPRLGTFYVDVRGTMRLSSSECASINGLPEGSPLIATDPQGWSVRRYAINVVPPPPPAPAFGTFTVPTTSVVGQPITLTIPVVNSGGASDDGRVSVAFPGMTDPGDAQWVTVGAAGDQPGYQIVPAGGELLNASCQPMASSHLAVEYVDADWQPLEPNTITVTVRPQEVGTFTIDIRAVMHPRDGVPCVLYSAVPGGQSNAVDQQGFAVRRYAVTVIAAPPTAPIPVWVDVPSPPAAILLGQTISMSMTVRNDGLGSDEGRISFQFPSFTSSGGIQFVSGTSGDDAPGYRVYAPPVTIFKSDCQSAASTYVIADYVDANWTAGEINTFTINVTPPEIGTFHFYVRTSMHRVGGTSCDLRHALPAGGEEGFVDQFGYAVKRFTVEVLAQPPQPVPTVVRVIVPTSITLGQTIDMVCEARNDGATTADGRIIVSFPTLVDPVDVNWVTFGTSPDDAPGYAEIGAGGALTNASCQTMSAAYLSTEYRDNNWAAVGTEVNRFHLRITPQLEGTFTIDVRLAMRRVGGGPCDLETAVPGDGIAGFVDQQGFAVKRYVVTVGASGTQLVPLPHFTTGVSGLPASITLGENISLTATVLNRGTTTDDGRIVVSFPGLTDPADGRWVVTSGSGDAPGPVILPAGAALENLNCQPIAGAYLVAELRDAAWFGLNAETNTFTLTVQPQAVGPFHVDVRSTMRTVGATCQLVNAIPPNGLTAADQQGLAVKRFTVQVQAPSTPPEPASVSWQRLAPTGTSPPRARYGHAVAYDPARRQMVVTAGHWGDCDIDNWTLRLAGATPEWVQLPTFVGPGQRTDERWHHTAAYDPVGDRVLIHGGFCLNLKDDLMGLGLEAPLSWQRELGSTTRPSARDGHAMVYDPVRQRMLVIGGYDGTARNDVWALSLPGLEWTALAPGGAAFPPRLAHSAIYDPLRDRVIVFGGEGSGWRNDVWALELSPVLQWRALAPAGTPPSARRQHSAIYDPVGDRMVVFGGADLLRHSDLWELDLSGATVWTRLWSFEVGPANRLLHTAIYDEPRRRMIVYGGEISAATYSDEVWSLSLDGPTPTALALVSAEATPGVVRLTWSAAHAASLRATVYRMDEVSGAWIALGAPEAEGPDRLVYEDRAVAPGVRYAYRLGVQEEGGETLSGIAWVTVPWASALGLAAWGNPAERDVAARVMLPGPGEATLALYDLRGRRLAEREVGGLGAGEHRVVLDEGRRLSAGLYLLRLTRGAETRHAKVTVLR